MSEEQSESGRVCSRCGSPAEPPACASCGRVFGSEKGRTLSAKDVPDADFLAVVDRLQSDRTWGRDDRWVMRMEVENEFPDVPWKVLLAKARSLMKRGLMDGCSCGCRGDYRIEPEQRERANAVMTAPARMPSPAELDR